MPEESDKRAMGKKIQEVGKSPDSLSFPRPCARRNAGGLTSLSRQLPVSGEETVIRRA
jgi:hypothetical protein